MNKFNVGDKVEFNGNAIAFTLRNHTRSNLYKKMKGVHKIEAINFIQDGSKDGHGDLNCTTYIIKGFDVPVGEMHLRKAKEEIK